MEKVNLVIVDSDVEKEEFFVIFKDIKSMMKVYKWEGKVYY